MERRFDTDSQTSGPRLSGLAKKLVERGLMSQEEAEKTSVDAAQKKINFVPFLFAEKIIPADQLAYFFSEAFGVPLLDLDAYNPICIPQNLIRSSFSKNLDLLPIYKRGNTLYVAIADPTNFQLLDELKFHVNMHIEPILVEYDKLKATNDRAVAKQEASELKGINEEEGLDSLEVLIEEDLSKEEQNALGSGSEDKPIVRFVNKVLLEAINAEASDIHFEPYEFYYRIRQRVDGILYEHSQPSKTLAPRISTRLKVMSQLDISERRVPQDGRFRMRISKTRYVDFRVSSCPTLHGEKVVLRILDPVSAELGIKQLGFEPDQEKIFLEEIQRPHGMILVTGPTGSGKTVTLYTALTLLNDLSRNISTCEDPVEITLPGVNQVHVNPRAGMTFAIALKAFLRQDPDVIMVGEIRDLETAETGIKASQTGHMMLSTLHTNSAADTLTRLINMGIEPFNLATSVNLVIAQRLIRKLCEACKEIIEVPPAVLKKIGFTDSEIGTFPVYHAKGCLLCKQGYKGRLGLFELMPINSDLQHAILDGADALRIERICADMGFRNLRRVGLDRVIDGRTSLEEINRVTKD